MLKSLDNKKKIELTITSISIIILIFLIADYMRKSKSNKPVLNPQVFSVLEPSQVFFTKDETKPRGVSNPLVDKEKWGRDPFFMDSNSAIEQDIGNLILNGIVADKDNPYAIINNEIIKLGDKVSGMTVIEINEKHVILDENGQRHTLELNIY